MTEICIPIVAENVEGAISDIAEAGKHAGLIEIRLDFIKDLTKEKIKTLLNGKNKKVIITCRNKKDGGKFNGTNEEKMELLNASIEAGCDYIDIEHDSELLNQIIENKKIKAIVSYHNFEETPSVEELKQIYSEIKAQKADSIKIVTQANSINDNFKIFELLNGKEDLTAFCMGIKGQMSRILAPKYGSCLTFASLGDGKESASGQISIKEMKGLYHVPLLNKDTNVLGVIGKHAENSQSKHMHNPVFVNKKLNYVYMPFKMEKEEVEEFMQNFRKNNFSGSSVTMPHKEYIMDFLDNIDQTAKEIGAVNTIVNENGKLTGYNTDYYGAVKALKEKTSLSGKKILIIGAGGATRALVYGLKKENSEITIVNRTQETAQKLADEFNVKTDKLSNVKGIISQNDIIINATSVGMHPNVSESIIKENDFISGKLVMDIIYKPLNTKFIENAEKAGCEVITGDKMLIYQAAGQFELWTKNKPEFEEMQNALLSAIGGDS